MNRVATVPMQRVVAAGIERAQQQIARSLTEQATGKKAADYGALGSATVRNLSAHSLAARQETYAQVSTRLGTTLSLYDAQIGTIDAAVDTLRGQILEAVGTGQSTGLQSAFETTFAQLRGALNTTIDGVPLFGGSQTDTPFKPYVLADMAGLAPAAAFANDDVRASARIADGVDVQYGITASDVAEPLLAAFRTIADAGAIGTTPTPAQVTALNDALGQLSAGVTAMRAVNAVNGRNQSQAETLATRAGDRGVLLADIISSTEDADLGQIAIDLAQNKALLQASYSVFTQLANLSLSNYLR